MDKNLVVTCSPVYTYNETEVYLVHVRRQRSDCSRLDRIAVRMPDYKVVGLCGFSDDEIPLLKDYVAKNSDVIYDIAVSNGMPAPLVSA